MTSPAKRLSFKKYLEWLDYHRAAMGGVKELKAVHPGEVLKQELAEKKISQTKLAQMLGCTHAKVNEVIRGKRGVTARFACELEKVTSIKAEAWMRMQVYYDIALLR